MTQLIDLRQANIITKLEAQRMLDGKSMAAFSRELGVSRAFYHLMLAGERRFGSKIALGVSRRYPHLANEAYAFIGQKAA